MRRPDLKPLILLVTFGVACGGKSQSRDISQPPIRTGGKLESVPVAFFDLSPKISADGTKLTFISGRDTTDDGAQLRVYRADWPADGEPGEPARVTTEDLGFEVEAALSPDGSTIAVIIANEGQDNVYRVAYSGGAPTAITSDGGKKSHLSFSDDSALVAWRQIDGDGQRAFVADVAGGDPVELDFDGEVAQLFWIPGTYQIAILTADEESVASQLQTATFASAAAAADASFSALGETFIAGGAMPTANATSILASVRPLPLGEETVERIGDYETPEDAVAYSSDVEERPHVVDATSGSITELAAIPGDSLASPSPLADGFLFLSRLPFRCVGGSIKFGWSLVSMTTDTATTERYLPRRNADGEWGVVSDPCELTVDEDAGLVDNRMHQLAAATAGSATGFRAVFETRFSDKKDKDCNLKSGDPEIRVIEIGDDQSLFDVSTNPYDGIVDTDRGDKGPCT